jgi:antirestriction protein ArdC
LKDDKKAVFVAASHAQRATDFLHGLQPKPLDPDRDAIARPGEAFPSAAP